MKCIHPNEIKVGSVYLFRRAFSSASITWEPAKVLERKIVGGRDGFMVRWILDFEVDQFKAIPAPFNGEIQLCKQITAGWIKREYSKAQEDLDIVQKKIQGLSALSNIVQETK